MDDDCTQAAWHQLEQEHQQQMELEDWQRLLAEDPEYHTWLDSMNHQQKEDADEIPRETR